MDYTEPVRLCVHQLSGCGRRPVCRPRVCWFEEICCGRNPLTLGLKIFPTKNGNPVNLWHSDSFARPSRCLIHRGTSCPKSGSICRSAMSDEFGQILLD